MTGPSFVPPDAAGVAMSPLLQPLLRQVGLPPLPDPTGALAQAVVSGVSCDSRRVGPGTLFVGLGLTMFHHAGLMTGGTVGLAFLAHYATGWAFGPLFFAINLLILLLKVILEPEAFCWF